LDENNPLPPLSQIKLAGWVGEREIHSRTGESILVSLSLQPIQPGGDDRLSLAGTAHDLRELKKQQKDLREAYEQIASAHDELERMNQQLADKVAEETANLNVALNRLEKQNRELQKLDQLKSDFVSLVSHELRAPLTNINGGIEMVLARESRLPVRTKQSLELVQGEIARLTRFVETILDISALDAGRLPLTIAPLALSQVVTTIQRQMTHLPEKERVKWEIPDSMTDMLADENAVNSILFHLLDNAFKYAPEGRIIVSAGSKGRRGWITVTDQGTGIPSGAIPYLFDRFYRYNTEDDREVYGHGMGLYIVKRFLEAMQGSIEVLNLPEGGAQFTCWLPLVELERSSNAR
jgi:signal transduction histidine kinase